MVGNPTTEAEEIRELVKSAAIVNEELKRNLLLKSISRKFNLREKLLESELNKYLEQNKRSAQPKYSSKPKDGKPSAKATSENDKRLVLLEKELVDLLFEGDEEIMGNIFDTILPEDFTNKSLGALAKVVHDSYIDGNYQTAAIIDKIEDDKLRNYVLTIILGEHQISSSWDKRSSSGKVAKDPLKSMQDTIKKYQLMKIDEQIRMNDSKIENLGNDPEIINLMKANDELRGEKKQLNAS